MAGMLSLVGGDELKPGNEPQDEALVRATGDGQAYVLATAAARGHPDLAAENAIRWFGDLGLILEELPVRSRSDANSKELAARAAGGGFFYLVGGDPGLVVDVLDGSRVWSTVADAWRRGAALAGSSAGAMALGEWTLIRGGRRPDREQRRFKSALGIVPRTAILPHFDTFGHRWAESAGLARPDGAVLLGIDERTAAVWQDGAWTAAGAGGVTVIDGERTRVPAEASIEGLPQPVADV
jgi:cyanophycinase